MQMSVLQWDRQFGAQYIVDSGQQDLNGVVWCDDRSAVNSDNEWEDNDRSADEEKCHIQELI